MVFRVLLVGLSLLLMSCSFRGESTPSLPLLEKLKYGQTRDSEIRKQFGPPDRVIPIPESSDVAWVYIDHRKSHQRASFDISRGGILQSALLVVRSQDPEHDLKVAMKHFPQAHFTREVAERAEGADYAPNEVYFRDLEHGISINTAKTTGGVRVINWFTPTVKQAGSGTKPVSIFRPART